MSRPRRYLRVLLPRRKRGQPKDILRRLSLAIAVNELGCWHKALGETAYRKLALLDMLSVRDLQQTESAYRTLKRRYREGRRILLLADPGQDADPWLCSGTRYWSDWPEINSE